MHDSQRDVHKLQETIEINYITNEIHEYLCSERASSKFKIYF